MGEIPVFGHQLEPPPAGHPDSGAGLPKRPGLERVGFANAGFDALVEQALATADPEARSGIMAKLEQIMVDEGVIIQPYWRSLYNHSKSNLKGAAVHISNELYPQYMYWEA